MHLTSYLQDGTLTIALTGEIDHHCAKGYIDTILGKIEAYRPRTCVLDFRDVTFMDSSGIGIIMGRYRKIACFGGRVYAIHADRQIQRILTISGLAKVVEVLT